MRQIALIGSGPAARSPIARLLRGSLGAVKGHSYRTAVRLAGSLRAGYPIKDYAGLADSSAIFICVPEGSVRALAAELALSGLDLAGKIVVLCDVASGTEALDGLRSAGASVASLNEVHDKYVLEGDSTAVRFAKRLLRMHGIRPLELTPGSKAGFLAGLEFSGELLVPVAAAALSAFQSAGLDRAMAASILEATACRALRAFITAGRKGWSPPPDVELPDPELNRYRKMLTSAAADLLPCHGKAKAASSKMEL